MRKSIIRITIMLIVVYMVTGVIPVTAWAASSSAYFKEDFSEYKNGSADFAFGQFIDDGMSLDEYRNFDRAYNIGNALAINSGKAIPYDTKVYYNQSGTDYSLTEFDLYLDKRSGSKAGFIISPSTTYGDHEGFATLRIDKNILSVLQGETYTEVCTLEENKWHHFCIKISGAYKEEDLYYYDVSIEADGDIIYSDTETRTEGKMKQLPYYDMLKIGNRSYVPIAYIDNINVTYNGSSQYEGKGKLLYSVREAEELLYEYGFMENTPEYIALKDKCNAGIELLETNEKDAIAKAKQVYENAESTQAQINAAAEKLNAAASIADTSDKVCNVLFAEDFEDNVSSLAFEKLSGSIEITQKCAESGDDTAYGLGNHSYSIEASDKNYHISSLFSGSAGTKQVGMTTYTHSVNTETYGYSVEMSFDWNPYDIGSAPKTLFSLVGNAEQVPAEYLDKPIMSIAYIGGNADTSGRKVEVYRNNRTDIIDEIDLTEYLSDEIWDTEHVYRIRVILKTYGEVKEIDGTKYAGSYTINIDGINIGTYDYIRNADREYVTAMYFESNKKEANIIDNVKLVEYWNALSDGNTYKNDDALVSAIRNSEVKADICADKIIALQSELTTSEKQDVLEIKEIGFSDGEKACRILPDSGSITSLTVDNKTESNITASVVTAFYNDDRLVRCYITNDCVFTSGVNTVDIDDVEFDNNFTDAYMYIWKSEMSPLIKKVDIKNHIVSDDIDIYIDNKKYFTDVPARKMSDGRIYVPAENILNLLGARMIETNDGYRAERIDGTYMDFEAEYYGEDIVPMIDIGEIENGLGCSFSYDMSANTLMITSNYSESLDTRATNDGEVEYSEIGKGSFLFKVNCDSGAKVEAYTRVSSMPNYSVSSSADLSAYGKWTEPLEAVLVWKKAYDLKYKDGGYVGSFADLRTGNYEFDVIFKITRDGKTEMLRDKVALKSATPTIDEVRYEAESLTLKTTFENISYYLTSDAAAEASVYYKKKSDDVWSKGYTPVYNTKLGQYTGSVTGLNPNTEYDIKLVLDGAEYTAEIKTWNENPQYTEVDAADYMIENGTVVLQGIKGTEDNWIKIKSDSVINGGESNMEAVYISDCEYVILDGLKIDGARRYAISVSGGSENIRIQNCDIYGWGRLGVWSDVRHRYMRDLDAVNYDSAIRLCDADNVVIERCYIHDSNARCNTWYGPDYDYNHPTGGSAIYSNMGSGLVVRYNDFIGNSVNRWNDAIEGDKNGELHGGVGFDADIYGNMFFGGNDDAMELDGGGMNIRVYRNRIEQSYCGISYAPILLGPTYSFGNLIYNLGDRENYSFTGLKQRTLEDGETDADRGEQFFFNNTVMARDYSRDLNTKAINNILCSDYSVQAISSKHTGDYNFLYGHTSRVTFKENDIYGKFPKFTDAATGNFTLSHESEAIGNGTYIDNFMEKENPDMGAFAYGDKFLPSRPLDMSADKYSVTLKDRESTTITFTAGDVDDGMSYTIEKSDKETWLEIGGTLSGKVSDGGKYTITLSADTNLMKKELMKQNDTLCAAVLFRLSNGYSVPITVKVER